MSFNHAVSRLKTIMFSSCVAVFMVSIKPHAPFFEYFTKRLICQGLTLSKYDPCLIFSSTLIVIIYVDNSLIYCKGEDEIDVSYQADAVQRGCPA